METVLLPSDGRVSGVSGIAAALLAAVGVDFVVVGGCALVLLGKAADCRDLDIVPDPAPANTGRLGDALRRLATSRPPTLRALATQSITSVDGPYGHIDVMAGRGRLEYDGLAARSSACRVEGVEVRVASVDDVMRLKARYKEPAA